MPRVLSVLVRDGAASAVAGNFYSSVLPAYSCATIRDSQKERCLAHELLLSLALDETMLSSGPPHEKKRAMT